MKNLNPLNLIQINEFDLIKDAKRQPTRGALNVLRPDVLTNYTDYTTNFANIHISPSQIFTLNETNDLLHCYNKKTNALSTLTGKIYGAQSTEFQYICAYCLFHSASTIDHYIPKEEYAVFCVMPRNLLPCCSNCNNIKNQFWRGNGSRWFLHFYNDTIPTQRFLYCNLSFSGNTPTITYYLLQVQGISNDMFSLIQTHFSRLGLLELYKQNLNLAISGIKKAVVSARAVRPNIGIDQIRSALNAVVTQERVAYGVNYWQAVAMQELANSNQFLQTL